MQIVQYDSIVLPEERQRSKIESGPLAELKASILARGLMHPPVIQVREGRMTLVAGERRMVAIGMLAGEGSIFECDGKTILPGECPITTISEVLDPISVQFAELEENIIREDLPWQDRISAMAALALQQKNESPEKSNAEIAKDLAAKGGIVGAGGRGETIKNDRVIAQKLQEAAITAKHFSDPAIKRARNATEAYNLVMEKERKAFEAELIKRTPKLESAQVEVRHGDAFDILPTLEPGTVDLILADPPYGMGADSGGFRSRTVHHHNYEDTPEAAKKILQLIVLEGFRVTKPRANLFLFIDIDLFVWLKEVASRAGWTPFRTPITWGKSDSEGLAPWGRQGFRRTTEWIFYATKGQKGLYHSPIDYLRYNRVSRHEREYGPEKPTPLLRSLIESSTMPGDMLLDPCCGSGSAIYSARKLKRRALGIELDERAANIALVKAHAPLEDLDKDEALGQQQEDLGANADGQLSQL